MINIKTELTLKDFRGDSFEIMEQIEENIFNNMAFIKRNMPENIDISFHLSQASEESFLINFKIKDFDKSVSEDVLIGQIESNITSSQKRGILNIGLHEWELKCQFI